MFKVVVVVVDGRRLKLDAKLALRQGYCNLLTKLPIQTAPRILAVAKFALAPDFPHYQALSSTEN